MSEKNSKAQRHIEPGVHDFEVPQKKRFTVVHTISQPDVKQLQICTHSHRQDNTVFPLESESLEKKQIFQEQQNQFVKQLGLVCIFFQFSPEFQVILTKCEINFEYPLDL